MNRMTLKVCRSMRIMTPTEVFDADQWKTKLIMVTVQMLYTIDLTWIKEDQVEGKTGFEYTCSGDGCDDLASLLDGIR